MSVLPAVPGWDGLHPALAQFPLALIAAAPVLLVVGLFARGAWRSWTIAALLLLALGAAASWFASATGHAAGQLVTKTPQLEAAILRHESLGVLTRNVATLLVFVLGALLLVPRVFRREWPEPLRIGVYAVFALVSIAASGLVLKTADRGGRLVHEYGVRAIVAPEQKTATAAASAVAESPSPVPPAAPQR